MPLDDFDYLVYALWLTCSPPSDIDALS
jgi:hypothetical protein